MGSRNKYKLTLGLNDYVEKLQREGNEGMLNAIQDSMDSVIDDYLEISKQSNLAATKKIHTDINKTINDSINDVEVSCKKGCSFCCHIPVAVSLGEILLLKDKLKDEERFNIQKNIKEDGEFMSLPFKDRACIYLLNDTCSVYEDRPMMCRKYFVVSPKEDCNTEFSQNGGVAVMTVNKAELITSAILTVEEMEFMSVQLNKLTNGTF